MEKHYSEEDIMKIHLKQAITFFFRVYGIERTQDKIKEIYGNNPKSLEIMLGFYKEILRGE